MKIMILWKRQIGIECEINNVSSEFISRWCVCVRGLNLNTDNNIALEREREKEREKFLKNILYWYWVLWFG